MAIISRLTEQDVSSRYEAVDAGRPGSLFTEYPANDRVTNRPVTIRLLNSDLASARLVEALSAQMARVAELSEPAVEKVLDLFLARATVALVVEPRRGVDLEERVRRIGAFPVAYSIDVAILIAEALRAAHAQGLVHGQLTPADVRLSAEGVLKVTGIGLAQAIAALPPDDRPQGWAALPYPSEADDLKAFGLLLHSLLTGQPADPEAAAAGPAALNERVPSALSNLVRCLVVGSPTHSSMDVVVRDLKAIRTAIRTGESLPMIAPPAPPAPRRSPRALLSNPAARSTPARPPNPPPSAPGSGSRPSNPRVEQAPPRRRQTASSPAAAPVVAANGITRTRGHVMDKPRVRFRPLRLLARFAGTVFGLVLLLCGSLFGIFFYADYLSSTPEVVVPSLHGKTLDQAKEMLANLGLKTEMDRDVTFSEQVPAGSVLRQIPPPGMHTKAPRIVHLFLSGGSRTVKVPEVGGLNYEDAVNALQSAGLKPRNNGDMSSATVPYGNVAKQWPPAGRVVPRGSITFLKVSAGPSEQDMEASNPGVTRQQTVSLTVPGGGKGASSSGASHKIEIKEVGGPFGDDRTLWSGAAAPGQTIHQDVTVDPFYDLKVYLDGKEIKTKLQDASDTSSGGSPSAATSSAGASSTGSSTAGAPAAGTASGANPSAASKANPAHGDASGSGRADRTGQTASSPQGSPDSGSAAAAGETTGDASGGTGGGAQP